MKFLVAKGRKPRERAEAPRAIPSAREGFGLGPGKAATASKACGNSPRTTFTVASQNKHLKVLGRLSAHCVHQQGGTPQATSGKSAHVAGVPS
jgi:hypothetical protein